MRGHGQINAIQDPDTGIIIEQTLKPEIDCLAFEGGGVACIAYAGVIKTLIELKIMANVKYVSGVSGGAIAALAVCLGSTSEEIIQLLLEMPMEEFMPESKPWWFTPQLFTDITEFVRIWNRYGSDYAKEGAEKFKNWLRKFIEKKLGTAGATNHDLDRRIAEDIALHGKSNFKKIYVGAVNISAEMPYLKIFGSDQADEIELAQMIFMSACNPLLWGAEMWHGSLWTDGGVKANILMDLFDDPRFHSETHGLNQGILGIKIDTQSEIDQVIWNKSINSSIKTTKQFAMKLFDALAHTIDKKKTQHMRNVIALSDCGVDRLKLSLPREQRLLLIEHATKTAMEYFENHMGAAAEIATYQDMKAWLQRRRKMENPPVVPEYMVIKHLIGVKRAYQAMLDELLISGNVDSLDRCHQLSQHIQFIDDYRERIELDHQWDGEGLHYPPHIDILPDRHTAPWHKIIEASLQERLAMIRQKISNFEPELQFLSMHYACKLNEIYVEEIHYGWRSEAALQLLLCEEYLEQLRIERDEIECKLGLRCDHHVKKDIENSNAYMRFYQKLHEFTVQDERGVELAAMSLPHIPYLTVKEDGEAPFTFRLDMRRPMDRKLYLIAALIFLTRQKSKDLEIMKNFINEYAPECVNAINQLPAFIQALGLMAVEVHGALFKLEAILHHFEKNLYPVHRPSLTVDAVFGLSSGSFFIRPTKSISVTQLAESRSEGDRDNLKRELSSRQEAVIKAQADKSSMARNLNIYFDEFAPFEPFLGGVIYHHGPHYDSLKSLVACDEYIKQWQAEISELSCQLHLHCAHGKEISLLDKQIYATFYLKMIKLNDDSSLSYALRAVMPLILPVFEMTDFQAFTFSFSANLNDHLYAEDVVSSKQILPFKFRLDMRDSNDRLIYLIAALTYLDFRGYKDTFRLKEIFQVLAGCDDSPRSIRSLMTLLKCDMVSAQLAMFRIECMLHAFDRRYYNDPAYRSPLNIDELWALPPVITPYQDVRLKEQLRSVEASGGTELVSMYRLKDRPLRDFVAQMSAYTDNHDDDASDSEDLVVAKSLLKPA